MRRKIELGKLGQVSPITGKWISPWWKPEMARQLYRLTLLGATLEEIALFFEVGVNVVSSWLHDVPEAIEAVRKGRLEADMKVTESLYKKCLGYDHVERSEVRKRVKNKETGEESIMVVKEEELLKHHEPDAYACLKWLALRRRNEWTESPKQIAFQGQLDIRTLQIGLKDVSTKELQWALNMGLAEASKEMEDGQEA